MKLSKALMSTVILASIYGCGGSSSQTSTIIAPTEVSIVSADSRVTLNLTADVFNPDASISVTESFAGANAGAIGNCYELGPSGTQFKTPISIKISYDPQTIPVGINISELSLGYFTQNCWEIIESSVVNPTENSIEARISHFSTVGVSVKNPYPDILVNESDFAGHVADVFRLPIGDDGISDLGNDLSLLSIDTFSAFSYPKIRFSNGAASWYVATAFKQDRWLNRGWDSEPSSGDASYYDEKHDFHPGEDWNMTSGSSDDAGKPVHAIANGRILFNGWKYGHTIILGHRLPSGEYLASFYGHLQRKPNLMVGSAINLGDVIGNIGNTGTIPFHLHFEVAKGIGTDGTGYMLKKNNSGEIIFNNESVVALNGKKYYVSFWRWPGSGSAAEAEIEKNWYSPSVFIKNHSQGGYTIKTLVLPGDNYSEAIAVNNAGHVVGASGRSRDSGDYHPFLFNGGMVDLGILPGSSMCVPQKINDLGQVVGTCYIDSREHAFLYSDGVMSDLGLALGATSSAAPDINNRGEVLVRVAVGEKTGSFIVKNGKATDIGNLPGCDSPTYARAINDLGQVAGSSCNRPFLYSGGGMIALPELNGYTYYTDPYAINNSGQIVGMAASYNNSASGYLYSSGGMIDLGSKTGEWWSLATDINNLGHVTIRGYNKNYLYIDGKLVDINTLGGSKYGVALDDVLGINDQGAIVGIGRDSMGNTRAVLIAPN